MKVTDACGDIIETGTDGGTFNIRIEGESAYSCDGGHSYDRDSFCMELTTEDARCLMEELQHFITTKE